MAWALRSSGTKHGAFTSGSALSLPLTTDLDDTIVVLISESGTGTITITGAGATWQQAATGTITPNLWMWVGYGCAGGDTTITITGAGTENTYVLGMFTGGPAGSPLVSASVVYITPAALTGTSNSITYNSTDLIVAACCISAGSDTWSATTWSNTESTTSMGANTGGDTYQTAADFVIASSSSSTTATYIWSTSKVANIGIMRLSLSGPTQTEQIVTVV
jgi:hypothetical protein